MTYCPPKYIPPRKLTTFSPPSRNTELIFTKTSPQPRPRATADPTVAEAPEVESKDELPVAEDSSELDLTPGMLEKTNDPVRMYLREMGTVPLLTREGEVAIAKRIERGQLLVLKTI